MVVFVGEQQGNVTGTQSDFNDMLSATNEVLQHVRDQTTIEDLAAGLSATTAILSVFFQLSTPTAVAGAIAAVSSFVDSTAPLEESLENGQNYLAQLNISGTATVRLPFLVYDTPDGEVWIVQGEGAIVS